MENQIDLPGLLLHHDGDESLAVCPNQADVAPAAAQPSETDADAQIALPNALVLAAPMTVAVKFGRATPEGLAYARSCKEAKRAKVLAENGCRT